MSEEPTALPPGTEPPSEDDQQLNTISYISAGVSLLLLLLTILLILAFK